MSKVGGIWCSAGAAAMLGVGHAKNLPGIESHSRFGLIGPECTREPPLPIPVKTSK